MQCLSDRTNSGALSEILDFFKMDYPETSHVASLVMDKDFTEIETVRRHFPHAVVYKT